MPLAIAIVLVLVSIVSIAYPLVRRPHRRGGSPVTSTGEIQRILDSRDTLLRALRELEYDKSLGNISDPEHRLVRADYEREAFGVYKELDVRASAVSDAIEREVQQARENIMGSLEQGETNAECTADGKERP